MQDGPDPSGGLPAPAARTLATVRHVKREHMADLAEPVLMAVGR